MFLSIFSFVYLRQSNFQQSRVVTTAVQLMAINDQSKLFQTT